VLALANITAHHFFIQTILAKQLNRMGQALQGLSAHVKKCCTQVSCAFARQIGSKGAWNLRGRFAV
jgi:hypothetical protein